MSSGCCAFVGLCLLQGERQWLQPAARWKGPNHCLPSWQRTLHGLLGSERCMGCLAVNMGCLAVNTVWAAWQWTLYGLVSLKRLGLADLEVVFKWDRVAFGLGSFPSICVIYLDGLKIVVLKEKWSQKGLLLWGESASKLWPSWHLRISFNPFTAPACKISGQKKCMDAPGNSIFPVL